MPIQKSICLPAASPVDIAEFIPIIDHPLFQVLRSRKQLGINDLIFPGAQHTRFEHAIGTLALTQRLCRIQKMPAIEAHILQAFALLHDIGHGPFSHQIEPVLPGDHHSIGLRCLEEMQPVLAQCGVEAAQLQRMLNGDDALAEWVSDRNLGTDKLDYLQRDALHIGFQGIPYIEKIQTYTVQTDKGLAIEEKFLEDVKQLQKFYSYLHQHGYLNKTALAAQRVLQRCVQEELQCRHSSGEELWKMRDWQLLSWLSSSQSSVGKMLYQCLLNRTFHRTFLSLKPQGYGFVEKTANKPISVYEWPLASLRKFSYQYQDLNKLSLLEDEIAELCHIRPGEILFAAMPYFRKLIPKDVRVHAGGSQKDFWLLEKDRDHKKSLESDYLRTFAVRLLVIPEKREQLYKKAGQIEKFLLHKNE
ncbi:MAG: HD domain-containing protein [Lentisphaeria bacterium]